MRILCAILLIFFTSGCIGFTEKTNNIHDLISRMNISSSLGTGLSGLNNTLGGTNLNGINNLNTNNMMNTNNISSKQTLPNNRKIQSTNPEPNLEPKENYLIELPDEQQTLVQEIANIKDKIQEFKATQIKIFNSETLPYPMMKAKDAINFIEDQINNIIKAINTTVANIWFDYYIIHTIDNTLNYNLEKNINILSKSSEYIETNENTAEAGIFSQGNTTNANLLVGD